MSTLDTVKAILRETLQTEVSTWDAGTALLGSIAEFDSMAVVTVITSLEDNLGIVVEDDEISAETFETVGSLVAFVDSKL
jgi:acyl carrier protein